MSGVETVPQLGSPNFWSVYDQLCTPENLKKLASGEVLPEVVLLQQSLKDGHKHILQLPRVGRGWEFPKAWLVLRHEIIHTMDGGHVFMQLYPCDVMVREFGWDRDLFITHTPLREYVSGQFLGQSWPGAEKGAFLPLYDHDTIFSAIQARLKENARSALRKAKDVSRDWGWYKS